MHHIMEASMAPEAILPLSSLCFFWCTQRRYHTKIHDMFSVSFIEPHLISVFCFNCVFSVTRVFFFGCYLCSEVTNGPSSIVSPRATYYAYKYEVWAC
jgi:hypothetical protein